jgi:nicotinamidase-related amidase
MDDASLLVPKEYWPFHGGFLVKFVTLLSATWLLVVLTTTGGCDTPRKHVSPSKSGENSEMINRVGLDAENRANDEIHIRARYCFRYTGTNEKQSEKGAYHAYTDWWVPLDQVALVCLDVWNMDLHQDMHVRDERITRERIVPLVKAARASGLQIIHAPSPSIARRHANWVNLEQDAQRPESSGNTPHWPPTSFRERTGEFSRYASPERPNILSSWKFLGDNCDFHDQVRPISDEPVIATGEELQRLCAQKGILFLLYAGFHTPGCMTNRSYGITEMRDRGYTCILVRDCTNGMETHETHDEQTSMKGTIAFLEHMQIYSLESRQIIESFAKQ